MPIGLSNAPAILQILMNIDFQEALDYFYNVYFNDIPIYLSSTMEHFQYVKWVLTKLRPNYFFTKPTKGKYGLV